MFHVSVHPVVRNMALNPLSLYQELLYSQITRKWQNEWPENGSRKLRLL